MNLVFVIVNYFCESDIEHLSVQLSAYGDIVVVDNSGTWSKTDKNIQVITPEKNLGFGRAIDFAISSLLLGENYQFLSICNPDITIKDFGNWDNALEEFSKSEYSFFQPLVLSKGYENSIQGIPIISKSGWALSYISFNPWRRRVKANQIDKEIGVFSGAFCIFKLPVLKATSGFSILNFLYFEELDMALKIRQKGFNFGYFDPSISVEHYVGATTGQRKGSFNFRMHVIKCNSFIRICRSHNMNYLIVLVLLDFILRLCLGYLIYVVALVTKPFR